MPIRVLIADGNADTRKLTERLLRACGFHLHVAHDSKSLLAFLPSTSPDVVLIDEGIYSDIRDQIDAIVADGRHSNCAVLVAAVAPNETESARDYPKVRRLNRPLNSNELLHAIFESTAVGKGDGRRQPAGTP